MTKAFCFPACGDPTIPMPAYPPGWTGGGVTPPDPTAPYVFCPASPSTALAGSADAPVTLTGQNLPATPTVKMNGETMTVTASSATSITFTGKHSTSPAGAETIQVYDGATTIPTPCTFTYTAAPILTVVCPLVPISAVCGSADIPVDVKGTNFTAATQVRIDGVPVATTFVSPTLIRFTATASTELTPKLITVGAQEGAVVAVATCPFDFLQTVLIPTLTSITPDMVGRNDPAETVTLIGTNFDATSVVLRGGLPLSTNFIDATTLTVQTDPATATTGLFEMRVRNGVAGAYEISNNLQGQCVGNPTLGSIVPNSAAAGSAQLMVTLYGTNYGDTSEVLIDGNPTPTTRVNSGVLTFNIDPAGGTPGQIRQISVRVGHQHGAIHDNIIPVAAPLTLPFTYS